MFRTRNRYLTSFRAIKSTSSIIISTPLFAKYTAPGLVHLSPRVVGLSSLEVFVIQLLVNAVLNITLGPGFVGSLHCPIARECHFLCHARPRTYGKQGYTPRTENLVSLPNSMNTVVKWYILVTSLWQHTVDQKHQCWPTCRFKPLPEG